MGATGSAGKIDPQLPRASPLRPARRGFARSRWRFGRRAPASSQDASSCIRRVVPCPAPTEMTVRCSAHPAAALIGLGHTFGPAGCPPLARAVAFDLVLPPAVRGFWEGLPFNAVVFGAAPPRRLPAQADLASHLGTLRRIARRGHRVAGRKPKRSRYSSGLSRGVRPDGVRASLASCGTPGRRGDPAERSAYRNCGLGVAGVGSGRLPTSGRLPAINPMTTSSSAGAIRLEEMYAATISDQFENFTLVQGPPIACSSRQSRWRVGRPLRPTYKRFLAHDSIRIAEVLES